MDWDNFRFFLELARTGRLVGAARRLEVDQATISRRVQALEKDLGLTLFVRTPAGMELTSAGRALLADAEEMEAASGRVLIAVDKQGGLLRGIVRVGSTEGLGATILTRHLSAFVRLHPELTIDLVAVSAVVNISRREADIVVSLERPQRGPFVVSKLGNYASYVYASESYLSAHEPIRSFDEIKHHSLIGYVDDLIFSRQVQFIETAEAPGRFALRSTSIHAQLEAAACGVGLVVLPAFLADPDPRLKSVLREEVKFHRPIWMTMPKELRQVARIKATWDLLRHAIESERAVFLPDE